MLKWKAAELYVSILYSRLSKPYRTKNNATSRGDSLCLRNSLCLVTKKWQFVCKNSVLLKAKTSNRLLPQWYLYFPVFWYSKVICIYSVDQIDFNVSETCLHVTIYKVLLQYNLWVLFSSIIQKKGTMCEKTGILKPLRIQLKCCSCFHSNFLQYMTHHDSLRLLASL